jgi:chemotaxis signal transduction protein
VSAPILPAADVERLLTFEVRSAVYALPIAEVHEVAEVKQICCVPTIGRDLVGVMNWHGDALPVVSTPILLEGEDVVELESREEDEALAEGEESDVERLAPAEAPSSHRTRAGQQVLVVSARDTELAQLGLPIDRVIGLVDGPRRSRGGGRLVVERRPVEGRVVSVLDPHRLVERAIQVIEGVA